MQNKFLSSSSSMNQPTSPTHQHKELQNRKIHLPGYTIRRTRVRQRRISSSFTPLHLFLGCEHGCRRCKGETLILHNCLGNKMGKKKSKDAVGDVRTEWKDPDQLKAFCGLCAAQVLGGNRSLGFLKKEGVDEVIKQLKEMGKIVSPLQVKNKWDHLRKLWKIWKQLFERDTGLCYDHHIGKIEASDEWWDKKVKACPDAKTIRNKGLPHVHILDIMFEGTVATGKNAWTPSGQKPTEIFEGSGDSSSSREFFDPQSQAPVDVDPMDVERPSASRSGLAMNKGKGLASNVQLFKGVCKRRRKHRSIGQELSDSLKTMTNAFLESRSVNRHAPPAPIAPNEVQQVMDTVLGLPGVQPGDRLHMFSAFFFMGNQERRMMFLALSANKEVQLKWLERQCQINDDVR